MPWDAHSLGHHLAAAWGPQRETEWYAKASRCTSWRWWWWQWRAEHQLEQHLRRVGPQPADWAFDFADQFAGQLRERLARYGTDWGWLFLATQGALLPEGRVPTSVRDVCRPGSHVGQQLYLQNFDWLPQGLVWRPQPTTTSANQLDKKWAQVYKRWVYQTVRVLHFRDLEYQNLGDWHWRGHS